jgi:hypothetical protein
MDTQSKENAATAPQKEPDHFLRFCCAVTFTDIVALRECDSKEDEKTIILRALVGIVLLLVTAPLWMLLLSSMLEFPLWAAIYGGCLISMVMFLLDTAASRGRSCVAIAVCAQLFHTYGDIRYVMALS